MPLIKGAVGTIADSTVHSVLDLRDGFFHIDIAEKSKKYLARITCRDRGIVVVIYMEDMFIKAANWQEVLESLKMVLNLASKHGLHFNCRK